MDDSGRAATVARVFTAVGFAGSLRRGSYNRALERRLRLKGRNHMSTIAVKDGTTIYYKVKGR